MSTTPLLERLSRSMTAAIAILALIGAVAGCGDQAPTEVVSRLADDWPAALTVRESARIDFGTAEARRHLGVGWYYDEQNRGTGETFVWSRGARSEIEFHLGWRRDLLMEIHGRPFRYPNAAVQTIVFELNGRRIGGLIEIDTASDPFAVTLPADAQVVGLNRLVAAYGRVNSPADELDGASDERELAFAWSEIVFDGIDESPVEIESGAVALPAGARSDHFVELAPGSHFRAESCTSVGESPCTLEISVLGETDRQPETTSVPCLGEQVAVQLGDREGLTRFRVSTRPGGSNASPTGVRLEQPLILSPVPKTTSTTTHFRPSLDPLPSRPNVIIYLVDALRSDRLGVYGCERPLSPRLDAFADQGIVFTDVTAQSSWTKAAVASIFTGIWPREHAVNGPDDRLPEHLPTIPELLHASGYRTAAVVANAYVGRPFGFARGFDHFEFIEHTRGRSEVIHQRLESWLGSLGNEDSPYFLYIHTIDPHAPYAPPEPFLEAFASGVDDPTVGGVETVRGLVLGTVEPTAELGRDLRALYDGEVAANDASFGRLLDELDRRGELDNTVIFFTSDHGEAFGEHDSWTHGLDLYNEVLSIPLVVRLPGGAGAGQRVSAPVQHIDILPTILGLCGVPGPMSLPGARLLMGDGTASVEESRPIFAYLDYWGRNGATVLRDGWKLVQPLSAELGPATELFRHDLDPTETRELSAVSPVRAGWLGAQLAVALETRGTSLTTEIEPAVREQLEALGYMH